MKTNEERIQTRLQRSRPMTTISIRVPEDVIEDLKEVAPKIGFSGYQPLIRAYIGQGLRKESLRRHGVQEEVISAVLGEALHRSA
jgi:predicted DNA binding CopG/RHH family protein